MLQKITTSFPTDLFAMREKLFLKKLLWGQGWENN